MQATRYRLRWVAGRGVDASTYGSGRYGDDTYGELAAPTNRYGSGSYGTATYGQKGIGGSDPLSALTFDAIPWNGGQPTGPSWVYRAGDTEPAFKARILADNVPADIAFIAGVDIVLSPVDGRDQSRDLVYAGAVSSAVIGLVTRIWRNDDLLEHGVYRCTVRLGFQSGRRLTIPVDDRHTFVILDESRSTIEFGRYGAGRYGAGRYGGSRIVP